ncbi:MAG: peptidoglycan DD-metalloendopeptidase family protein [Proteobacteria bacterium]|nr:peptidoglycan DD-metalloendopeptidase family protein [Pseudomonadota bacterium]HQR02677.1 peptidoglycan DD-metalloendopeptidase family protein [Rhodocyclaceae bacterium]
MRRRLVAVAVSFVLAACAGSNNAPAPVENRGVARAVSAPVTPAAPVTVPAGYYLVKKGDTLYSIALDHGTSYRELATWNSLEDPNRIFVGQQLRVVAPGSDSGVAETRPVAPPPGVQESGGTTGAAVQASAGIKREPRGGKIPYSDTAWAQAQKGEMPGSVEKSAATSAAPTTTATSAPVPAQSAAAAGDLVWAWPAAGALINTFSEGHNKGIDLAGKQGDPVNAAADGKVIYVGTLRGYGRMVIVKHEGNFSSVYGHNSQILVKEEQQVTRGQKLAEVGSSDSDQPKLHFEIRRLGVPVNPLQFLPKR